MNQEKVKRILLGQIREYLDGEITKEEYEAMAEPFYSQHCHLIVETSFYKIFSETIPDCCIINVDEPGNEIEKERDFWKILTETYIRMKEVL